METVMPSLFLLILFLASTTLCAAISGPRFACDIEQNASVSSLPFCNASLPINRRVGDLIGKLSLDEKIKSLAMGTFPSIDRLGIPKYLWMAEALHGIREGPVTKFSQLIPAATSFPQVILTAASFNVSLFQAIGKAISTEARAMYNVGQTTLNFWTPNVNIFGDPRWGRGQETPGEDPLLSSKYASAYVRGLQERDDGNSEKLKVAGCCKHYTAYDLESWHGFDRYHFNAIVTEQDLEDTYNPPFKSCVVDGKVAGIMSTYNKVNGKSAVGDRNLVYGVIRGQWRLDGFIVSDCDGVKVMFKTQHYTKTKEEAAAVSILAGLDLDCGFFTGGNHTKRAIKKGLVKESDIDKLVFNNLRTLMRLGFFDGHPKNHMYGSLGPKDVCSEENQELALDAARQGIVLLKNSPASLPLSPASIKHLAVIGPNANVTIEMLGNYAGLPCKNTTFLEGLSEFVRTSYETSCHGVTCHKAQLDKAKEIASVADATVLVMGLAVSIETETKDRTKVQLPGKQERVAREVAKVSKGPVILVIMSGGGVDVSFAKANRNITSILWVGYPGEAGGAALAEVIFGLHNPGGKLPITWYPQSYVEKVPMNNMNMRPEASRGYPGRTYRFYKGETVYSFGDGISYSEIKCKILEAPDSVFVRERDTRFCDGNASFDIHLELENVGNMRVRYSVLLFSTPPFIHNSPRKQLVDFKKVALDGNEATRVKFTVDICKHLSVVDESGRRRLATGNHIFQVEDARHSVKVEI